MAGRKIWVLNSEYARVSEADRNAQTRRREADRKRANANAQRRQVENEMNRMRRQSDLSTQQALDQIQNMTNALFAENDALRAEMERQLLQYTQQTQRQLADFQESVTGVEIQAAEIDRKIDALSAEVAERFRELADAAAQEKQRAQLYASQYALILRQIHALHPEKLTPGEVEQNYDPVADFLEMDLANGDYQAAIGVAQTKMPEALAFQLRLEVLNAEFSNLCSRADYAVQILSQNIRHLSISQENIRMFTVGNAQYEYDGDLMYWTDGLFQLVIDNFENTCGDYETAESGMDLERMRRCLEYFNQIDRQLERCGALAEEQFLLFAAIGNLADSICSCLTGDEAWTLTEDGFINQDMRGSFQMSYTDGDGNTATFVLLPRRERDTTGEIQFLVDVINDSGIRDANRCFYIRQGLLSRLLQAKIEIGANNRDAGYHASPDKRTFLTRASAQGNKMKEERLEAARMQLQLT